MILGLGLSILSFMAPIHLERKHWVPAMDTCTVTVLVAPHGSAGGTPTPTGPPVVECSTVPAHWGAGDVA